ncbi:MAG TPA: cyclic nucleotide-binding domain-containing protein [Vicinamibacteria bacterium]
MSTGNWWPILRAGELVRYLSEEEYVKLLDDTVPVSAEPGDVIFFKGAPSNSLVIVVEGELVVFEESKGRMLVLGTVPAGSVVGEVGFLDGRPRTRHVRAKTACDLRKITREGFLELLNSDPTLFAKVNVALTELLAARYRAAVEELEPVRALAASLREVRGGSSTGPIPNLSPQSLEALQHLGQRRADDPEL